MDGIVYFELNNWTPGEDYPDKEPFITWMGNDLHLYFDDEEWVKKNKLCVVKSVIDMSANFCITATEEWVKENCPSILAEDEKFRRLPDEDGDVYGRFDNDFLEYSEENIGIHHQYESDDGCWLFEKAKIITFK